MKKIIFFFIIIALNASASAQQLDCSNGRYHDSLFAANITLNVNYGQNKTYLGVTQQLVMDIYQPQGDVATKRPLLIIAPGGSFVVESKSDYTTSTLCRKFATMGYVAVGIDYRVGVPSVSETQFIYAALRAEQDFRAAIRYFKKDAATSNTYKVDTNIIIEGGSSAGAFTALDVAYLKEISQLPVPIDTTVLGGIQGSSGNPGYTSNPNYVVSLCGAIADTGWIHSTDVPLITMHGTNDNIVPYATDTISVSGFKIMLVNGSASIKKRCDHIGLEDPFYTFIGAGHTPYDVDMNAISFVPYMDTTFAFIRDNLYPWVCETINNIPEITNTALSITIAPNPFTDCTEMTTSLPLKNAHLLIFDITGKEVARFENINGNKISINRNGLTNGIYFYKLSGQDDQAISIGKLAIQ